MLRLCHNNAKRQQLLKIRNSKRSGSADLLADFASTVACSARLRIRPWSTNCMGNHSRDVWLRSLGLVYNLNMSMREPSITKKNLRSWAAGGGEDTVTGRMICRFDVVQGVESERNQDLIFRTKKKRARAPFHQRLVESTTPSRQLGWKCLQKFNHILYL